MKNKIIIILLTLSILLNLALFTDKYFANIDFNNRDKETTETIKEEPIDVSDYAFVMPVQLGTKWIYEGKRIYYDATQDKAIETVAQKNVEITGIKRDGPNLRVFTITSYKNEPDFIESRDSFLISQSGFAFDGTNLAYFPLVKGQRLTAPDLEWTDDLYVDYVTSVSVKNVFGKKYRCYDIFYYGLPDESLEVFCEGVGYIQDSYKHHGGTPNEIDYRLIRMENPK